ncbi:hypothetical protein [Calycomorphotria hydatis]|uniref:Uncharacterized protein n=1 Tax=Calycomorphotria hydatis TaxID=2528027 RepID=A0A517T605_9PLAN|nr:hypothetical protein [Calycomorphotria hydatis]QDT63791.1 hypothetical protein V22_10160 [Calycomorphotria hydatis]
MRKDTLWFVPDMQMIHDTSHLVGPEGMAVDELLTELFFCKIIILGDIDKFNVLCLEKVDALGFTLDLRTALHYLKEDAAFEQQVNSTYEYYRIDLRREGGLLVLSDQFSSSGNKLSMDFFRFEKRVHQCCSDLYKMLIAFYPNLLERKDVDRLRKMFVP